VTFVTLPKGGLPCGAALRL